MSVSIDPYSIVKDFLGRRKEQKELDSLVGKYYRVVTGAGNHVGRLSRFDRVGKSVTIVLQVRDGEVNIPFDNVQSMQNVSSRFKLDELINTISYEKQRLIQLSWIIEAAKPVKDGAKKWFNEEVSHLSYQINILMNLFPHRSYQSLQEELDGINQDFQDSIIMLDEILSLVEQKKATSIKEIYHPTKNLKTTSTRQARHTSCIGWSLLFRSTIGRTFKQGGWHHFKHC